MSKVNPYQTPDPRLNAYGTRPVRALILVGCFLAGAALIAAVPGVILLNQEAQLFSVDVGVYDIQIGDVAISNAAIIALSGTFCFLLWSMAAGSWGIARRNHHLNQR